jgi:hypothetical protein
MKYTEYQINSRWSAEYKLKRIERKKATKSKGHQELESRAIKVVS